MVEGNMVADINFMVVDIIRVRALWSFDRASNLLIDNHSINSFPNLILDLSLQLNISSKLRFQICSWWLGFVPKTYL